MTTFAVRRYAVCASIALLGGCAALAPNGMPAPTGSNRGVSSGGYAQLYRFGHPQIKGTHPAAGLLNSNGLLYGTTPKGGVAGNGTLYSVTPAGVHKVLYRFRGGSDGSQPQADLIDVSGTLYGTTEYGGASNDGTVYAVSLSGGEKVLYSFQGGADGANPVAGLTERNGMLYGTTLQGGGNACKARATCGTVFSVSTQGAETVLHSFSGGSDGASPLAGLINVKGVLYGTTQFGGSCAYSTFYGCGTVYSITTAGVENVLHSFQGRSDGFEAFSSLTNVNGVLYGTTFEGGEGCGSAYSCGTVYRIDTTGKEKVIYSFTGGADGANPQAGLLDVNGTLYGTTYNGGGGCPHFLNDGCGTIYSVTTGGTEKVLYSFTAGTDGWGPVSSLTDLNGTLYGTTPHGGYRDTCCANYGWGTVFTLTP